MGRLPLNGRELSLQIPDLLEEEFGATFMDVGLLEQIVQEFQTANCMYLTADIVDIFPILPVDVGLVILTD